MAAISWVTGSACYIMGDWECMLYQGGLGVHAISWVTGSACYIMEDWECMLYHG